MLRLRLLAGLGMLAASMTGRDLGQTLQTKTSLEKIARGLAVLAGTLDTVTGAGLVFVPALMLRLMLVCPVDAGAETFLRFTGIFVALVGGVICGRCDAGGASCAWSSR